MQHQNNRPSDTTLSELLSQHLAQVGWSERQLANRANISRGTIRNWCKGVVERPRDWRQLIRAASSLRLTRAEADELLQTANHVSIAELQALAETDADKQLLLLWIKSSLEHIPFQVIPDLPYFVGRQAEITQIKHYLQQDYHQGLYVICGMAGVGKTALAAHLAYVMRNHFTDGILWLRVDSSDTMSLLQLMANSYGVDVSQYSDRQSRSQIVRSHMAHKKALLILDNVENSRQIQPLLPPNGACAALVTTRRTDLRITQGHLRFPLKPFAQSSQNSQMLFDKILGGAVVESEATALSAIADLLGHLPLALAIVAGHIAYEPHITPTDYLARLQTEAHRLSHLTNEDQSVQASLSTSYSGLSAQEQQFFTALGLFSGEDFSLEAAAAVTDVEPTVGRSYLAHLCSLSLVQTGTEERYRLHPLIREYAQSKNNDFSIYTRMIHYYADYVGTNMDNYRYLEKEMGNIIGALDFAYEQGQGETAVQTTLNIAQFLITNGLWEVATSLLEKAEHVASNENCLSKLALIKSNLGRINTFDNTHLAQTYLEDGLALAHKSQDENVIALVLKDLGRFHVDQNNYEEARAYYQKSFSLAQKTRQYKLIGYLTNYLVALTLNHYGNYLQAEKISLEGISLQRQYNNLPALSLLMMNFSMISHSLGKYGQAEAYINESGAIARQINYPLVNIIITRYRADLLIAQHGDYEQAQVSLKKAEKSARELGRDAVTGFILSRLGMVTAQLGQFDQALAYLDEALPLSVKTKRLDLEIECCTSYGYIASQRDQHQKAESYFHKALSLARLKSNVWFLCETLDVYSEYQLRKQNFSLARVLFTELLEISSQTNLPAMIATAQFGLAQVAYAEGKIIAARQLGEKSYSLFEEIDHYDVGKVRAWIMGYLVKT